MIFRHLVHVSWVALALVGCAERDSWTVRRSLSYSIADISASAAVKKQDRDMYTLEVILSPVPAAEGIYGRDVATSLLDRAGLPLALLPEVAADSRLIESASGTASIAHIHYRFRTLQLEFPLELQVEYRGRVFRMCIRGAP